MNKIPSAALLIAALALPALWQGCSRDGANQPPNDNRNAVPSAQAPSETPADREFIERSKQAIERHKLTKLPVEKLAFELVAEAPAGTKLLNVRERHDPKAGGDPATAPRLFSIRLEFATGVLWTDAKSAAAEFEPLPK